MAESHITHTSYTFTLINNNRDTVIPPDYLGFSKVFTPAYSVKLHGAVKPCRQAETNVADGNEWREGSTDERASQLCSGVCEDIIITEEGRLTRNVYFFPPAISVGE